MDFKQFSLFFYNLITKTGIGGLFGLLAYSDTITKYFLESKAFKYASTASFSSKVQVLFQWL